MISFLLSVLRLSTPLIFTSLGGLFSERTGVINIALEGLMLVGAFAAAVVALETSSPFLAWVSGGLAGVLLAGIYALLVIRYRADQVVSGMAINLIAAGLTPFLCFVLYDDSGATPNLMTDQRFEFFPLLWLWVCVATVIYWYHRTRSGLWFQFAGEHPAALEASGYQPRKIRLVGVLMSGLLAGWGGASLSILLAPGFVKNMTAGRGFMALAALILGKWKPIPTVLACLFFGAIDALQIRIQSAGVLKMLPVQLVQILPYLITLVVLAGFVGNSRPPKEIGKSY